MPRPRIIYADTAKSGGNEYFAADQMPAGPGRIPADRVQLAAGGTELIAGLGANPESSRIIR